MLELFKYQKISGLVPSEFDLLVLASQMSGTSAASERNFSLAGHVVCARKSPLKSSSVNNLLLLNSALKPESLNKLNMPNKIFLVTSH